MTTQSNITRAMVLGAGMGSRMRDLTREIPKPMVTVGGRALIDHVLDRLGSAGVTDAVVNVHYKADVLEAHLKKRTTTPHVIISDERHELLDTGGGIRRAQTHLGEDPFIIHNSDSIWHEGEGCALQKLAQSWNPKTMDTLLLLADPKTTLGYDGAGDFILASDGTLTRHRSNAQSDGEQSYVFTGVSIAHPRLFENAPNGAFSLNVLWDRAIAVGRVYGVLLDGQWMHVGTPEAVAEADATFDTCQAPEHST